jgi:hypothetical protein
MTIKRAASKKPYFLPAITGNRDFKARYQYYLLKTGANPTPGEWKT